MRNVVAKIVVVEDDVVVRCVEVDEKT